MKADAFRHLVPRLARVHPWLRIVTAALLLSVLLPGRVHAGAIVVGRGPDCTVPTIHDAIQRANGFGGYNLILVTDEVPDGVYHENLLLQNLREDLVLELVGGYSDCTTLAPTAFGKASLYGGDFNRPTLRLRGHNVATFRGFWMQGGAGEDRFGGGGIDFRGYGTLVLENVRVAESDSLDAFGAGILVEGQNGIAALRLDGRVEVTDQGASGINGYGYAFVQIGGAGNAIRNNSGNGLSLYAPAFARIGATGTVIHDNGGFGVEVDSFGEGTYSPVQIYSTDATDPLRIASNARGALHVQGSSASGPVHVCLQNALIEGNGGVGVIAPMSVYGDHAFLDINPQSNVSCGLPAEAYFYCATGTCNRIRGNVAGPDLPLVSAGSNASIRIDRVIFEDNTATSLLSTNLDMAASTASITMTTSLALRNTLRDNLFEALNGGIVDIRDSTIARNDGGFSVSLVGSDPTLFQVTDSIIDQPQALVYLSNGPVATTHFNRVLAHNRNGAQPADNVVLGQPTYRDAFGRLSPESLGVDYAPVGGGADFDGNVRDIDTANLPNQFGPRDLGAFESQVTVLDSVFADGFEAAPAATARD